MLSLAPEDNNTCHIRWNSHRTQFFPEEPSDVTLEQESARRTNREESLRWCDHATAQPSHIRPALVDPCTHLSRHLHQLHRSQQCGSSCHAFWSGDRHQRQPVRSHRRSLTLRLHLEPEHLRPALRSLRRASGLHRLHHRLVCRCHGSLGHYWLYQLCCLLLLPWPRRGGQLAGSGKGCCRMVSAKRASHRNGRLQRRSLQGWRQRASSRRSPPRSSGRLENLLPHRRSPRLYLACRMACDLPAALRASSRLPKRARVHHGGPAGGHTGHSSSTRLSAFPSTDMGHSARALPRRSHLVALNAVAAYLSQRSSPFQPERY